MLCGGHESWIWLFPLPPPSVQTCGCAGLRSSSRHSARHSLPEAVLPVRCVLPLHRGRARAPLVACVPPPLSFAPICARVKFLSLHVSILAATAWRVSSVATVRPGYPHHAARDIHAAVPGACSCTSHTPIFAADLDRRRCWTFVQMHIRCVPLSVCVCMCVCCMYVCVCCMYVCVCVFPLRVCPDAGGSHAPGDEHAWCPRVHSVGLHTVWPSLRGGCTAACRWHWWCGRC